MGSHQISVILVILAFASARAADDFPSRTNIPSDCPDAASGCWCRGSFAQCWRTYDDSHMTEIIGNRITKLELLFQPSEEVVKYIRRMSALREIRISEDGMSLDCSCDMIHALNDKGVTIVNQAELTFRNCRKHGFHVDTMTSTQIIRNCRNNDILGMQDDEARKRRETDNADDDVSKRASPRKGDKPAGHKVNLKDLDPSSHSETHHFVSIDGADRQEHHPASEFVNFISGHRRNRRSTSKNASASERSGRKKRYGYNQMGGGTYPAVGQGQAPMGQPAQQGYAPRGMAGPVRGGGGGGGAMTRPVAGGAGFGAPGTNTEDYDSSSTSENESPTISAKVMENIKAVLGATKIDLPVDINDPYDLGLLLRHLRHHSNLLANIGDPEVREQVLSAMQEEEAEEEEDAANGVRENVLGNLGGRGPAGFGGAQGGMGGIGGGPAGGGRGGGGRGGGGPAGMARGGGGGQAGMAGGGGGGGGMMGYQGMGGQAPGTGYFQGYQQG